MYTPHFVDILRTATNIIYLKSPNFTDYWDHTSHPTRPLLKIGTAEYYVWYYCLNGVLQYLSKSKKWRNQRIWGRSWIVRRLILARFLKCFDAIPLKWISGWNLKHKHNFTQVWNLEPKYKRISNFCLSRSFVFYILTKCSTG